MPGTGAPTPGWYPNPDGSDSMRYWDGQKWTAVQANDAPTIPTAPIPAPTPAEREPTKRGPKIAGGIARAVVALAAMGAMFGGGGEDVADAPAVSGGVSDEIRQAARDAKAAPVNAELQCEELATGQADSPSTVDLPGRIRCVAA
ncbi:DUF2510 domain-containing protein [Rhodococcus tukisamuensis]|uniref:DUF2510 domain-containing protein n=1 Tax=Rhodococcus tukisamuensis TaxID=168276 RepID=A0A1G6XNS7_9NOCA|nr:DUF2510 domain-containing protein [Rhodococcus tukisamuensis]SDD79869.1 Protein of unknown function [Rhodococcus tukisamuensis]